MKKLIFSLVMAISVAFSAVAQSNDLQPLVIIKLNKTETITLKQLKNRVNTYKKQTNVNSFTVEQKKDILNAIIDEKLIVQAAQKAGLQITDSQVNQYFLQSISQQVGKEVTEAEFAAIIKQQANMSLDDFMMQQVGMNVADYKAYLKNQLVAQQYVLQQKQNELQRIAPTDQEIRSFYELNKSSFVLNDMLKLFLVIVPKSAVADEAARTKANKMLNDLKDKKLTMDGLKAQMQKEGGKTFQAGDIFISKSAQHAEQLGISYQDLIELFGKDKNFTSALNETNENFQFYIVREKYEAKMLSISDIVQPETTITVYDYIKQNLTQQKQSEFLVSAVQEISKSLDTPENVDRKKKGDELNKLLEW